MSNLVSRAKQKLMDSSVSIAPSERIRSAAVVMSAPVISVCHSTYQCRSDVPAIPSTSENVVVEEDEKNEKNEKSEEEEENVEKADKRDECGEEETDNKKGDDEN